MSWLELAEDCIKKFEGCELKAYPDPGSGGDPWTIGWGATGPGIKSGVVWTQRMADTRLAADIWRVADKIHPLFKVSINDHQFAALISFAYNVGVTNLQESTLLKKLNAGDYTSAAEEFPRWNKASGRVLQGLVNRRAYEKQMFLTPD